MADPFPSHPTRYPGPIPETAHRQRSPRGRFTVAVASVLTVAALAGVAVTGALAPGGSAPGVTEGADGPGAQAGNGSPPRAAPHPGLTPHPGGTRPRAASVADPSVLFHQWYSSLSAAEQFAFALLALDDDERMAADAFFTPPPPPPEPAVATDASVWDALAQCESSGNWSMNSGNGFHGGLQFMHSTWVNMGGRQWAEYPHEATRDQQIEVATRLQAAYGWGQWPACSARLGLR